jgi:isoquinoline 1-oxidoreductase subunit beta
MNDTQLLEFDEIERYELSEGLPYQFRPNRRQVVQILGAGLVIAVSSRVGFSQQRRGGDSPVAEKVSERFHIAPDGTVTVMTSKVEVGQGSRTQLTQAAAEELHLPMSQIQFVMADTALCPDDGGTAGSRTTPASVPRIRNAAAAARELLIDLAAQRMKVDRAQVTFKEGRFVAKDVEQRLTLAELAGDADFAAGLSRQPEQGSDVAIASVENWQVLGESVPKVNGNAVVTGAAKYPSDVVRPEMLYGKILRPPTLGSTLTSIDTGPAQAMDGVTVVHDGNFVGCAAKTSWRAARAIEAIAKTAKWDSPPQPSSEELFALLKQTAQDSGSSRRGGRGGGPWGQPDAAFEKAAKKLDTSYTVAYIQHAPMEPRAAVAEWSDGALTVWTGSQQPSRVRDQLAEAFRMNRERVRVIVPDTGGGFGGKHSGEAAVEAARLAQSAKRPVSLRWTREEEFTWAYFRPAGLIEVRAGLDESNNLLVWQFTNYNSGGSALDTPYQSPHGQTQFKSSNSPLKQGSYRALASTANTFARESAIDELAELAGVDPLDFRLKHLPDGRLKDVLEAAARRFDWRAKRAKRGNGRGVGIACGTEKGSFVATCADVEVVGDEIKVRSTCTAFECGAIQNPANLRSQVAGSLVMGLGGALFEEIRFKDGKVLNGRFSEYRVPRMEDLPELDIELIDRKDLASVGAGETPIIAIAPAVAGGVFQATSQRMRSLPMKLRSTT